MFEIFNTREIAVGIWLIVFSAWVLRLEGMASQIGNLIRTACVKPIMIPFAGLMLYMLLVVLVLAQIGFWNLSLLKTTIFWFLTIACVAFFRIPTIADDEYYLRNTIKDNIKVIVAIQFVVNFFTFPLWVELISVPSITFLTASQAFSKGKPEYAPATSFISGILMVLGLVVLGYCGYKLTTDFASFAQYGTLKDFVLPFILSIALLPFTIVFAALTKYECAFGYQAESVIEDKNLLKYAKVFALRRFSLRTKYLARWTRNIRMRPPKNRSEVRRSIALLIELDRRASNPPEVSLAGGWSPYRAITFLESAGIVPDDYHQGYEDGSWSASSTYTEIGKGDYPCNVSYYVRGNEHVAQELTLILNVNDTCSQEEALSRFSEFVALLFECALLEDIPDDALESIVLGHDFKGVIGRKNVSLSHEEWPSGRGRSFTFAIENPSVPDFL